MLVCLFCMSNCMTQAVLRVFVAPLARERGNLTKISTKGLPQMNMRLSRYASMTLDVYRKVKVMYMVKVVWKEMMRGINPYG
jgi:hypothetical protein